MSQKPDATQIAADVAIIHNSAKKAGGKLILASFGQNPETGETLRPRIESFSVGDITRMTERAISLASERHRNVYVGLATMRAEIEPGRKGGEADIVSVIGLVADFDAREDPKAHEWAERLPIPPTMVLETSGSPEPSYQCRFIFDTPVSMAQAKSLAKALQIASGCDNCTADISHVWRLAGGLNWPNKLKVEKYGRPPEPQLVRIVKPFSADRLVSPEVLMAALDVVEVGPVEVTSLENSGLIKPVQSVTLDTLDQWNVPSELKTIIQLGRDPAKPKKQDNSRSAWLFHAVCALLRSGVPAEVVLSVITNPAFKISESVRDKGARARDYALRQIARAEAEATDKTLETFNSEHAVVENYGSKTVVFSFDKQGKFFYRTFEDFKRSNDHRKVPVSRGGKVVPVGQGTAFLENPHRRQFKSIVFLPGLEAEDGVLNLYRGPSVEPKPGDCDSFLEFTLNVICDGEEDHFEWVLNYVAHIYQKPWEAPEVCIVLRGRQGVGKNFFIESIGEIVADYFIVVSNPKHLVSGFNRHLMDKLVVFADEAFFGNERRYAGILKNLVTQSQMAVEPKGVDVFMAKKYFRLFMASNEDFVVPADLDDRRFLVLDVSDQHAKDHVYFGELRKEWDSGGREAFYYLMLKRDISEYNHRDRPETLGLAEQKLESLVGAERLVFEMLSSGEAPMPLRQPVANFIATEALRHFYAARGLKATSRSLAIELAIFAMHPGSKREAVEGHQARGFWVPTLGECRSQWEAAKHMKIDWPEDDGEWIDIYRYSII
jgi:hypothetical protein